MPLMQAVYFEQFGSPEVLHLKRFPRPTPGPGEVLVKVSATALNRADTLQRMGKYPPPPGASPILGLEMAGEVVALGPNSNRWNIGDKICGLLPGGGYAEYAVIHEDLALPVPERWTFAEAAAMPEVFMTAYQALIWLGRLKPGEDVMIHAGGSGVGTAAIQIARQLQAKVLVTASAAKHARCIQLGAQHAIDYKNEDFATQASAYTQEKGVDVILDFMGASYFQQNVKALAKDGRLILLAFMGGAKVKTPVNLATFLQKRISLTGTSLRSRSLAYKIKLAQDLWDFAKEAFEKREMIPVIDSSFPWDQVAEAHRRMEANLNIGKIVLEIP